MNKKFRTNLYSTLKLLFVFIIILFSLINLDIVFSRDKVLGTSTEANSQDLSEEEHLFLENLLKTHPDYLDGIISLSEIEYQRENIEASQKLLENAFSINPNSEKIKELMKNNF